MSVEWHYFKDRERAGPVSEDKLKQLVQEGRLLRTDKLWNERMPNWTDAEKALPGLFAGEPPPLPTESPSRGASLVGRALKLVLDQEWQKFLDDAWKAWRASSVLKKSLLILTVLVVLSITLWVWLARATSTSGEEPGLWSRLWDSGLITGLAGLVFAFLKKKLEKPNQPPAPSGGEAGLAPVIEENGFQFLGLSRQQWLGLLVALFIPTLLVSLVSSFLVGSPVHLWLTGPVLLVLGMAISVLSVELNKRSQKNDLAIGVMVGASALILYALTCINTRWVLLFYTLLVIFPTLHLFTVARRGAPPIRLSPSLLTGFGVIGLALGITALPRNEGSGASGRDESEKLASGKSKASITEGLPTEAPAVDSEFASGIVGQWELTEGERIGTVQFTKGGMVVFNWHWDNQPDEKLGGTGKYRFVASDTMEVEEGPLAKRLGVDMPSDNELILVEQSGIAFTGLKGRLCRVVPKPPPTGISEKRLVGKWEIVEGEQKGTATFTESGTVQFVWYRRDLKQNLTNTGNYSMNGKNLKIKASGEYGGESVREIEFLSDDELLIQKPTGSHFSWLFGRLKRVK